MIEITKIETSTQLANHKKHWKQIHSLSMIAGKNLLRWKRKCIETKIEFILGRICQIWIIYVGSLDVSCIELGKSQWKKWLAFERVKWPMIFSTMGHMTHPMIPTLEWTLQRTYLSFWLSRRHAEGKLQGNTISNLIFCFIMLISWQFNVFNILVDHFFKWRKGKTSFTSITLL